MQMLPHLTLEQIDEIDLPRYMRAWEARELAQSKGDLVAPDWDTEEKERAWRVVDGWLRGKVPMAEVAKLDQGLVAEIVAKVGERHG